MNEPTLSWPYWHVDAKWLLGLLLVGVISLLLLAISLYRLTEKETAVTIGSTVVATAFSPDGLDSPKDIELLKGQAAQSRDDTIQVPNLPLTVTKTDLATLSPRQLRLKLWRQITESVYTLGPQAAALRVTNNPQAQKKFVKDAFFIQILTQETHDKIGTVTLGLIVTTLLLLIPFVLVSHGFGRFGNPGLVLGFSSLPGAMVTLLLMVIIHSPQGQAGLVHDLVPLGLPSLQTTYLLPLILGLGLLLAAGIGSGVKLIRRRAANQPQS